MFSKIVQINLAVLENDLSYMGLTTLSQVIGKVVVDVSAEATAILWIQPQDLSQSLNTDVLQVTVGECLHVSICLDHLTMLRQVSPNQIPFACSDMVNESGYKKMLGIQILINSLKCFILCAFLPRMAWTIPSFKTSREPEQTK